MAGPPPPLPPRNPSEASLSGASTTSVNSVRPRADTIHLTPYSNHGIAPANHPYSGGFDDPRSSSTQSLRPVESAAGRRTLLLIYIHGFMGDETSFKSFPAHVHNVLTATLADTHIIHSKVYPRYKSRKKINFARDDFSHWLAPHESSMTDVVLVGHSLGGILAAEVILMPAEPASTSRFRHDILGLVAFDTPFLGIHPGVIGTGIASLFRPAPAETPEDSNGAIPGLQGDTSDPNFNPAYTNDVHLATRSGTLNRAFYFVNKHWGELNKAATDYIDSHMEHGGVLADYPGLKRRYNALRGLEDVDPYDGSGPKRVRFVNYYSASTGRIKERAKSPTLRPLSQDNVTASMQDLSLASEATAPSRPTSNEVSPRISLEEHRPSGEIVRKSVAEDAPPQYTVLDPMPEAEPEPLSGTPSLTSVPTNTSFPAFPELDPLPDPPADLDESHYTDAGSLKIARKEQQRRMKAYEQIKKDREKTLHDRQKLMQKREKAAQKEQAKKEKEQLKRSATLNPDDYDEQLKTEAKGQPNAVTKKQKDRKFCTLPSKDERTGMRDTTWVRVYMEGMDEVVAHTSMFKVSEAYAKLVGDTAHRIEEWIHEDATRRAVLESNLD